MWRKNTDFKDDDALTYIARKKGQDNRLQARRDMNRLQRIDQETKRRV